MRQWLVLIACLFAVTAVVAGVWLFPDGEPPTNTPAPRAESQAQPLAATRLREVAAGFLAEWPADPAPDALSRALALARDSLATGTNDPRVLADASLAEALSGARLRRVGGDGQAADRLLKSARQHFDRAVSLDESLRSSHEAVHTILYIHGLVPLKPGEIHVRVVDGEGIPVSGVAVWVGAWHGLVRTTEGLPRSGVARTDQLGVALAPIDHTPPLRTVCARAPGGESGGIVIVDPEVTGQSVTVTLKALVAVEGEVTWRRPSGLPNQVAAMIVQNGKRANLAVIAGNSIRLRIPPCEMELMLLAEDGWKPATTVTVPAGADRIALASLSRPK